MWLAQCLNPSLFTGLTDVRPHLEPLMSAAPSKTSPGLPLRTTPPETLYAEWNR